MSSKKVVAFDFDGVVGDSVKECYVMSMQAFQGIEGSLKPSPEVEEKFRAARPFVKAAEDYDVILRIVEKNPAIDFNTVSQEQFEEEKKKYASDFESFNKRFYDARSEWQKTKGRDKKQGVPVVATNKVYESASRSLGGHGSSASTWLSIFLFLVLIVVAFGL